VVRVGDGQEQLKSGKKHLRRRRGIIPDGMVHTQLHNFVVKFPNLGMQGGCNQSGERSKMKTASCKSNITDSGEKRKFSETGDKETGGQLNKVKKLDFLSGTKHI
jgi:hypothetical protein